MQVLTVVTFILALGHVAFAALSMNGQRLAQGLTPLRPAKFGRLIPGKQESIFDRPTAALRAKRSSPSGTPNGYSGRIQVLSSTGSSLGYVENTSGPMTIGGVNLLGPQDDLYVSFTASSVRNGPFNIMATSPNFDGPLYVGASGTNKTIGFGSANSVSLNNVNETPQNAVPVLSSGGVYEESAIWSLNMNSKQLTAQFINADGSKPATYIAYDIDSDALFFVGDIDAHNRMSSGTASLVTFQFCQRLDATVLDFLPLDILFC